MCMRDAHRSGCKLPVLVLVVVLGWQTQRRKSCFHSWHLLVLHENICDIVLFKQRKNLDIDESLFKPPGDTLGSS